MADEEIRVLIEIEDADALQKAKEFQEQVDVLKSQLQSLANTSNRSFDVIAEGMRRQAEEAKNLKLDEINLGIELGDPADPEKVKEINDAYRETLKNITVALRQVKDDQGEVYKQGANLAKQSAKEQTEASKQSQAAIREYEKITRQGYGVMSSAAQQYSQIVQKTANIIQNTAQRSGQSWQQVAQRMTQLGVPINQINNALKLLNTQVQQVASTSQQASGNLSGFFGNLSNKFSGIISSLGNFGNIAKYVFGSVLGVTAINILRDFARAFKEFAEDIIRRGTEMTEVMFTFQVAIRGLQRTGLDTTIGEWTTQIQALKNEFPFFPKREFTEATSLAALMTREFGFTAEQIGEVVRMSAILAQITGKDLLESVRGVTYAIGSGYFESLQRAGVNISRQIVANEALRQGYTGVYNELEQTVRASVTYSVIQQNLASIQADASAKSQTFAGQVQILNSRLEDLKNLFGEVVTSSDSLISSLETLNNLVKSIYDVYEALAKLDIDIFAPFKAFLGIDKIISDIQELAEVLDYVAKNLNGLADAVRGFSNLVGGLATVLEVAGKKDLAKFLRDFQEELFNTSRALKDIAGQEEIEIKIRAGEYLFTQEEWNEIRDATQELQESLLEIEEDYNKKRQDIKDDYWRDVEKNAIDHYRKMEDLEEDHQQRMDDIELKRGQQIADEISDYNYRVIEAQRDAAQRREDAERKYRDREIREERKFQEKLRQLRENFLLDLEDAVRERDARQIIRLTRQYNLRRDQMIREEKISKDDRQAAFEEELREIERQRQERLRQLAIEHERRLKEIDLQAERERERAKIEYERRKDDEEDRYNEQKTDRKNRLAEQLDDIETSTQDRINKILEGIQKEYDLSSEQLNAVGLLWESYYGPDGRIDRAVTWIEQRLAQSFQFMNMLRAQLEAFRFSNIPPGGYLGEPPPGYAKGGTIIAKKPTVALFGEAGPEMATFTPLNKLPDKSAPPTQMFSARDPQTGRIRLEMLLSPDLEARIIDNTLGEIADVNLSIERARK